MKTFLAGRLRNTSLPLGQGLLPLFEAVVNSIHSVDSRNQKDSGEIRIEIVRIPQTTLPFDDSKSKRGVAPLGAITGFKIIDNGVGFNDDNLSSFRTLDSDYKAELGCRGVGRLMWLKAFNRVEVTSDFVTSGDVISRRYFTFTPMEGVSTIKESEAPESSAPLTTVYLDNFSEEYSSRTSKTARVIANNLLEHCLWYFVRPGGAPTITLTDEDEYLSLSEVYDEYIVSSASTTTIALKDHPFELTHIKLKATSGKQPFVAWCAAGRLVQEEMIGGKIPGLYGKLSDESGDFVYACYVSSPFLTARVQSNRVGFDVDDIDETLFAGTNLSFKDIRKEVFASIENNLGDLLKENQEASLRRVESFSEHKSPRYRPLLKSFSREKLNVDPGISDRELEIHLHKLLMELEGNLLSEGQELMNYGASETPEQYRARLDGYLTKVEDIKKSDLANYVFHWKVVLDILQKVMSRQADRKYSREELVHELIIPMRRTSGEVTADKTNLWLIDERLAFHNFLASDKTLSAMPITSSTSTKEPDIVALNVFDEPLLVAEGETLPLASITVVEIKRPMRNDADFTEDKNPILQALGYLERIRNGETQTEKGRLIPESKDVPGYCYVLCDITPSMKTQCKLLDLRITADKMGYFGYNTNYNAFIEVLSFDRLFNAATQRNRAFFDKLGLPN